MSFYIFNNVLLGDYKPFFKACSFYLIIIKIININNKNFVSFIRKGEVQSLIVVPNPFFNIFFYNYMRAFLSIYVIEYIYHAHTCVRELKYVRKARICVYDIFTYACMLYILVCMS